MTNKDIKWLICTAGAIVLLCAAAGDTENVYFPSVRVAHTNYANYSSVTNMLRANNAKITNALEVDSNATIGTVWIDGTGAISMNYNSANVNFGATSDATILRTGAGLLRVVTNLNVVGAITGATVAGDGSALTGITNAAGWTLSGTNTTTTGTVTAPGILTPSYGTNGNYRISAFKNGSTYTNDQVFALSYNAAFDPSTGNMVARDVDGQGAFLFSFESLYSNTMEWNMRFAVPDVGVPSISQSGLAFTHDWTTGNNAWNFGTDTTPTNGLVLTQSEAFIRGPAAFGLILAGGGAPHLDFISGVNNSGARNYFITENKNVFGDFVISQSTVAGGQYAGPQTDVLQLTKDMMTVSGGVSASTYDLTLLSLGSMNTNHVVDFSTLGSRTGSLTNDTWISVSGMPASVERQISYRIYTGDTNRNVYWQTGLSNSIGGALPSVLPSNQVVKVTFDSWGSTVTNVDVYTSFRVP